MTTEEASKQSLLYTGLQYPDRNKFIQSNIRKETFSIKVRFTTRGHRFMGGISTANQQYIGPVWNSSLDLRINSRDVLPLSLTYVTNPYRPSTTRANLITIPRQIMPNICKQRSEFAVPKFLLTNICSLAKTKNCVRAVVALETDLRRKGIDVCIVSETHLKTNVPNSAVDIHNYDIYRRDRNWSGMDKMAKGGIGIYVRKNVDIVAIYNRSSLYELVYLVVRLPSGHMLVVCGFYRPPRPTYQVKDLVIYLADLMGDILDKFPGGVIVAGGDVNRLDPDELCSMTGWKALVCFPTRGDSILDVFTNRSDLFGKCKPYNITAKTDHTAVIIWRQIFANIHVLNFNMFTLLMSANSC